MELEEVREYCLSKKGVTEHFPFDEFVLVFKVGGKMFLLTSIKERGDYNLKCDPEKAIELREKYESVKPGYHMNKQHWNTVTVDGSFSKKELIEWIDDSYELVFNSLTKKIKESIL